MGGFNVWLGRFTEVMVINPAHAKALKGTRPTPVTARLAELLECGLLQGSYLPSWELREARDLTRYRVKTVQARGRARTAAKLADLSMALEGRFTGHHAAMCRLHPARIRAYDADISDLDLRIVAALAPWQREASLLKTIPRFGDVAAWVWIAEAGPTPA